MNREQDDIDRTIEFCHNKIKNEDLSWIEKKALLFYAKKLKYFRGCPDNQKFMKPEKCIGGYGDQNIRGERKVKRKYVEFYNGMPQEEYINWQRMKISGHCY